MPLKTTVIINEVTNLSDARYCAGMGVDYIGFRIDENHNKYVDLENFSEITNWVAGVLFIGETSIINNQNEVDYEVSQLLIDDIEIITQYSGQSCLWSLSIDKIEKYSSVLSSNNSKIAGIVLTSTTPSVSEDHKTSIKSLAGQFDLFLSFGITSENVIALIEELPIKGVSLKGSNEIRPGFKDYDELADILEQLEVED